MHRANSLQNTPCILDITPNMLRKSETETPIQANLKLQPNDPKPSLNRRRPRNAPASRFHSMPVAPRDVQSDILVVVGQRWQVCQKKCESRTREKTQRKTRKEILLVRDSESATTPVFPSTKILKTYRELNHISLPPLYSEPRIA